MSAKIELQTQRQKLIEQLKTESDPRRIASLQSDLTIVNAEIKKLNITEAAENQRNASVKKALGQAQHDADIARANERITAGTAPGGGAFGFQTKKQQQQPQTFLTRGEFMLKNAKQILRTIDNLKNKLPHTVAFEGPLRDFIAAQTKHVEEDKARRKQRQSEQSKDDEQSWEETWETGRVVEK